jgi:hypothetical protein
LKLHGFVGPIGLNLLLSPLKPLSETPARCHRAGVSSFTESVFRLIPPTTIVGPSPAIITVAVPSIAIAVIGPSIAIAVIGASIAITTIVVNVFSG